VLCYATLLPGPQVRGTGGTLNLIEFLRRPWPPGEEINYQKFSVTLKRAIEIYGSHPFHDKTAERMGHPAFVGILRF